VGIGGVGGLGWRDGRVFGEGGGGVVHGNGTSTSERRRTKGRGRRKRRLDRGGSSEAIGSTKRLSDERRAHLGQQRREKETLITSRTHIAPSLGLCLVRSRTVGLLGGVRGRAARLGAPLVPLGDHGRLEALPERETEAARWTSRS
jgi:hypothetical protein